MRRIYFPLLHKEFIDEKILSMVILIDPGIGGKKDPIFFTPPQFPLTPKEAKKYTEELLRYGEFFKDPKEIQQNFLLQLFERDTEKPSQIKSHIKKINTSPKETNYPLIAQTTLLLEWTMEEKIIELEKIEREIGEDMKKLKEILGDSSVTEAANTKEIFVKYHIDTLLPYEKLLPWFFFIMEEGDVLFTDIKELYERWTEFGISFSNTDNIYRAQDKGWKFIFKKRSIDKMKWLDKMYRVEFIRR